MTEIGDDIDFFGDLTVKLGQIISELTTISGLAPFVVASTIMVPNLNVEYLGGYDSAYHLDFTNQTNADDLHAIEGLTGTGFAKRTGANAWTLDTDVATVTQLANYLRTDGSNVGRVATTFRTANTFDASEFLTLENGTGDYGRVGLSINAKTFNSGAATNNDAWALTTPRSAIKFSSWTSADSGYDTKYIIQHRIGTPNGSLGILSKGYSTTSPALELQYDGTLLSKGQTVWHAGNDGTGSGLDADLLDGYHASSFQLISQKNVANGYAGLDASGKISSGQLPSIAITDTFVVNSQAAMLALSLAEKGDVAIRTDLNKTFILADDPYSTLANWKEMLTPTDLVSSVNGMTGAVTLTTSNIAEGSNLYFTSTRVLNQALTGYVVGANTAIAATDTILGAFQKIQGQISATTTALSGYVRIATADNITAAHNFSSEALKFSGHYFHNYYTGSSEIYVHYHQSGGNGATSSFANLRVWDGTAGNFRALRMGGDGTLTWSGQNIATQNWVTSQGYTTNAGTVTSVGLSAPTGLTVSGSPITASGTLALTFTSGYSIPTTANQANWSTAYGWGNHASAGYVRTSIADTISAAHDFTSTSLMLSSHSFHNLFDASGNVYVHYYKTGSGFGAVTTKASHRVWNGSGGFKTLYFDGGGTFTWDGANVATQSWVTSQGYVPNSRTISAGTGLTGGGDLTTNRTLSVNFGTGGGQVVQGDDSRVNNGQTAFGWGNHASAGYVPGGRTLTINGTTYDLTANRSWTISGGSGTVTQVGLLVPTGFDVLSSPVTGSGNIQFGFTSGYSLPTIERQNIWNEAFARVSVGGTNHYIPRWNGAGYYWDSAIYDDGAWVGAFGRKWSFTASSFSDTSSFNHSLIVSNSLTVGTTSQTGQLGVHDTGAPTIASAILYAQSTTRGFRPPSMTLAQFNAIPSKAAGLMAYSNDASGILWYDGTSTKGIRGNSGVFQWYNGSMWITLI